MWDRQNNGARDGVANRGGGQVGLDLAGDGVRATGMRFRLWIWLWLVVGVLGVCRAAVAQPALAALAISPAAPGQTAAAPVTAPDKAQLATLIAALENDATRNALIAALKAEAAAPATTQPTKPAKPAALHLAPGSVGAELLSGVSGALAAGSAEVVATIRGLTHVHLLGIWLRNLLRDQPTRALLLALLWRLVVVAAAGLGVQWLVWRGLHRLREKVNAAAPTDAPTDAPPATPATPAPGPKKKSRRHTRLRPNAALLLRRLPLVGVRLAVDMLPLCAFAGVLYGLLATPFGAATDARIVLLGLGNAYLLVGVGLTFTHALLSPETPGLRLIGLSDHAAAYLTRWSVRLLAVALSGYMLDQIGLLLGMYLPLREGLIRTVGLILHVMVLVMIVQLRRPVARRLRAPRGAKGALASLRNWLAGSWHIIAIFYNFAIWLIFAFEVREGFLVIWRDFLLGLAVVVATRLVGIVLHGAIERSVSVRPDLAARYPDLPGRVARYRPVLHGLVNFLLWSAALVLVLQFWRLPVLSLFEVGSLGGRVARALARSFVIVLVAVVVWELANAAMTGHLNRLDREAHTGRAARLRTLLPMLRTALLVVVLVFAALTILNQVGVNTAPLLAGAGVVGIAIGFGSQKLVQDVITGLFLLLENAMQVGDWVTAASLSGTVETLSIRTLRLRGSDGSMHVVPFSSVTTVSNASRDFGYAMLPISAGYNEEPDRVVTLVREVVAEMKQDARIGPIMIGDLEVWGVDKFDLYAWVLLSRIRTLPSQGSTVQREFNRRMKYRFDELGIESPLTAPRVLHPTVRASAPTGADAPNAGGA